MHRSQRLRLEDVLFATRLVRQACELGDDPAAWQLHLMTQLGERFGAAMADSCVMLGRPDEHGLPRILHNVEHGLDPAARRIFNEYLSRGDLSPDPMTPPIMSRFGRTFVVTRQQVVDDSTWYGSPYFNDLRRAMRVDHTLVSLTATPDGRYVHTIGLARPLGDAPFTGRERALLRVMQNEFAEVWRTPPLRRGPVPAALPPYLHRVLEGLSRGLSEKQVAAALGLSRHSVHAYAKELHRRFGVNSRGELLAANVAAGAFRPRLFRDQS